MKLLAFDTALNACSVALWDSEAGHGAARTRDMPRGHAEALMPMIDEVMREAGAGFAELDRFAVTIGPGSFTGLRVGVAAGRGLALASGKPLVGVGTLQALAQTVLTGPTPPETPFMVVLDARREDVYCQQFEATGEPMDAARVMPPALAAASLDASVEILFGSGAALVRAALPGVGGGEMKIANLPAGPDARALAMFAARLPVPTTPPRLLYLRPPDAKPQTARVALAGSAPPGVAP